ncbi:MAG TPA: MerR family transcriptional regulator [Chloroflexota bacterium]|jgi:MerR family transcriptional regulator/heat shock protein HspR|nr:MerR family transcriptional regulator [Chloroflexota bacterium]
MQTISTTADSARDLDPSTLLLDNRMDGLLRDRKKKRQAMKQRRHYTISIAAELVSVHQQTIRHYERIGLIEPYRGKGEIRYFSPEDIDRLLQIRRLVEELGVNLAGVEVILNMREQLRATREQYEHDLAQVREQYETETARLKDMILRMQGE